jgi:hypothetical protein
MVGPDVDERCRVEVRSGVRLRVFVNADEERWGHPGRVTHGVHVGLLGHNKGRGESPVSTGGDGTLADYEGISMLATAIRMPGQGILTSKNGGDGHDLFKEPAILGRDKATRHRLEIPLRVVPSVNVFHELVENEFREFSYRLVGIVKNEATTPYS